MKAIFALAVAAVMAVTFADAIRVGARPWESSSSSTAASSSDDGPLPTVTLTVIQPQYFLHSATVTVQWQITNGQYDPVNDYVSSWWSPFAATYLFYVNVTGNSGSATFELLNGRAPIFFRYYRGSSMVTQSEEVIPEYTYPMQIHVMFVPQHPDRAVIMWNTNRTNGDETVYFGTQQGNLQFTQNQTTTTTYTQNDLANKVGVSNSIQTTAFPNLGARDLRCAYGTCYNDNTATTLFADPGQFHVAELTGLTSNTVYYFQVGEASGYMSDVYQFHSRVAPSASASIQVLYVADAGVGDMYLGYSGSASHNSIPTKYGDAEGARHVWDAIRRDPLSANDQVSIMNGDISYARGWPWIWELFANETEQIFSNAPVMAIYGNHEYDYGANAFSLCQGGDSGGEAGIPTGVRFNLQPNTPWYHMAHGPVHFFALSSEHSAEAQSAWLRQELPTVDRTVTPWVVVFLHRPIHESSTWIDHELQALFETSYSDLFSRYGVDLVLAGHAHYYERMCPINSGSCNTYGYRPNWTLLGNQSITDTSCVSQDSSASTIEACKVACMSQSDCTGAYIGEQGNCNLITCSLPFNTQSNSGINTYSLARLGGNPPIYIVDGTAGGAHTPTSSPSSPNTEYKDFSQWGYSRIIANSNSLTWNHYHIDGTIVDTVTLSPVNV